MIKSTAVPLEKSLSCVCDFAASALQTLAALNLMVSALPASSFITSVTASNASLQRDNKSHHK